MMTVFDPNGQQVARGDTVASKTYKAKVSVPAELAAKPWSLRLTRASKGAMEDLSLTLGPGCARFLATHPSRLLVP